MVKEGRPRRGSLQFSPRKRSKKMIPRVRSWANFEDGLQGFIGYKVGMVTAVVKSTNPKSPVSGKEIMKAATVVEVPPLFLRGVRLYKKTVYGAKIINEANSKKKISELKTDKAKYAHLLFETQAKKAGFAKKTSEIVEIGFNGTVDEVIAYAKEHIDKEVKFSEVFSENTFFDVTAVTKGKGLQGPVKRFGVKLQFSKTEKARRKVGSLGPWTPQRTPWQVAMAGQTGFHTRTEYNKQILKLTSKFNSNAGWKKYGVTKGDVVLVLGTLPGPQKRAIRFRKPIRANKKAFTYELSKVIVNNEVKTL